MKVELKVVSMVLKKVAWLAEQLVVTTVETTVE